MGCFFFFVRCSHPRFFFFFVGLLLLLLLLAQIAGLLSKEGTTTIPTHTGLIYNPKIFEMWKGYIIQLLKSVGKSHRAQLSSWCSYFSFTLQNGWLYWSETAETFGMITKANKFRLNCARSKMAKRVAVMLLAKEG